MVIVEIGRARHHGVERHRRCRWCCSGAKRCSPAAATSARCCCTVRRVAIFVILLLAYLYYRSAGEAQLASIGLLSFAAIAQLAPAFFGGLIWRRGTARGAHRRHDGRHPGLGLHAAAAELRRRRHRRPRHPRPTGRSGIALLRPQALFGLDLPPLVHGVVWSLSLNIARLCRLLARAARRPRSSGCRPTLFVPPTCAPMAPSFRLWRSSVTVEELTATVARYLGEERTRTVVRELRRERGASASTRKREADFQLLRYAEHLLASAIGAASSRLVLSLLLRKRTVSTKAALKLLDDATAAIQYNREILQTALDHVRQGIAVFDKDLQLICWNRQFGEILDLPPELARVGVGLDEILRFNAERGALGPGAVDDARARAARRATSPAPSRSCERFAERGLVIEVRANRMPDGGIVTTFTDITAERGGGRSAGARQRDAGAARARAHRAS